MLSPTRPFGEETVVQVLLPIQCLDIEDFDTFLDGKSHEYILEASKEMFEIGKELFIRKVAIRNVLSRSQLPFEIRTSPLMTQLLQESGDQWITTNQFI